MELAINIAIVSVLVFIINVPAGLWRGRLKKLSFWWFVSIHLPIPFVVGLRFLFDLGFAWYTYPFLVGAFFAGQLLGKKIYQKNHPAEEAVPEKIVAEETK